MAMRERECDRQSGFWIPTSELARSPGHPPTGSASPSHLAGVQETLRAADVDANANERPFLDSQRPLRRSAFRPAGRATGR